MSFCDLTAAVTFWNPNFLIPILTRLLQGISSSDECTFQAPVSTTTVLWKSTCVGDSRSPPADFADWSPTFSVEQKKFWIVNQRKCRGVNKPLKDRSSNHKVGEPTVEVHQALSPEIDRDPRSTLASRHFAAFLSTFLVSNLMKLFQKKWNFCQLTQKSFPTGCLRWFQGIMHVLHTFQQWCTQQTKYRLCCCKIAREEPLVHDTTESPPPTSVASQNRKFSPIRSRRSSAGPDSISAGLRVSDLGGWFDVSAESRFQWEVLLRVSKKVKEKEVSLFSPKSYRKHRDCKSILLEPFVAVERFLTWIWCEGMTVVVGKCEM